MNWISSLLLLSRRKRWQRKKKEEPAKNSKGSLHVLTGFPQPLSLCWSLFHRLNDSLEREKHVLETAKARKYEADRELITHQIEDSRRRREMEREHNIIQDQVDMRRAKARAKEEEDLKIAKRQREKAAQEQLRLENERHKALKAEQKRKEFEAEKRMEEEYRAKIEREEKARTEAFKKRMETMGRFEAKYATEGAGAKERENVRINEERLQREVQRKQQLEEANASKRDMERKERIRLASEENYRIMQEKEELRLSAKREGAALKLKYQAELDESSQTAAKEAARKRQKAMELKRGLDEQVSFKRQCESKEAMNGLDSRERELNKSLLKKMEQDPKYQHAIYERLHPTNKRETSFAFA
ncbi:unnamed protein product [Symbiodinium microadriaticum]|nr:unnamed protein product [Symbiodinium microadriaticum]